MDRRHTLAAPAQLEGVGVHTGRYARLRLLPAEAGSGIVFVRTDQEGPPLPAHIRWRAETGFATVLRREATEVRTVEHVLAALYALRVDDVRIELDGPEVPILDGSARPFVEAILAAGRRSLDVPRTYLVVVRPLVVSDEERRIAVYPCAEFRITYAVDFAHPLLGYQELTASVWSEQAFAEKLAPARTFVFAAQVEALRRSGRALGGSLENAVVLGEDRILNDGVLRFPDEFVRHKMLDLTGDLALLGYPLRGHVVAYRAGHRMHTELVRRLHAARDCWYLETARTGTAAAGAG